MYKLRQIIIRRINCIPKTWLSVILIIFIPSVIYYNSLNNPFIGDDITKIVNNPDIKNISNILTKLVYPYGEHIARQRNDPSRPAVFLTYTFNYHFGKLNPFGYHLVNLLCHIVTVLLIFFFLKKIIYYAYKKKSHLFPLIVSILFAVHPLNTSVVTYIYGRPAAMVTALYISSLYFFISKQPAAVNVTGKSESRLLSFYHKSTYAQDGKQFFVIQLIENGYPAFHILLYNIDWSTIIFKYGIISMTFH